MLRTTQLSAYPTLSLIIVVLSSVIYLGETWSFQLYRLQHLHTIKPAARLILIDNRKEEKRFDIAYYESQA